MQDISRAQSNCTVAIVGHVDHGKSTVIGRLLADTGSLPEGKLEAIEAQCARSHQPFEYAYLVDALRDERAQGITIDAARIFFRSPARTYQIVDAPGHVEFVRNMFTGAARASAALLVVDANEGIQENSRRHAWLLAMLGVRQVAVVVNKMDQVAYAKNAFASLESALRDMLGERGVLPACVIPVVARDGDNIARRSAAMPWYDGPTVLAALDCFEPDAPPVHLPFRMPVQDVYKREIGGRLRRVLAGTIASGRIAVGDEITVHPAGKRSRVASIEQFPTSVSHAAAGDAIGITLEDQLYVRRGALLSRGDEPTPPTAAHVRASLFWLSRTPMVKGKPYALKLGTARVTARMTALRQLFDTDGSLVDRPADSIGHNQVGDCDLELDAPIAFDHADALGETSRFVVVDDYAIQGGGIVRDHGRAASHGAQPSAAGARGTVVWLTGLSGAGKSTLAVWLEAELRQQGRRVERLDGDTLRHILPNVGFSRPERDAHIQRVGHLASRLEHHGVTVIAAFISPYAAARNFVRELCTNFVEVYVSTPLGECERRDPKGLYARARRGEIEHFTGIDDAFEPPTRAEVVLDTSALTVEEAGSAILDYLAQREA
ncbi:MAG TPA: adenylyl-sulfate kinase [Gemmatimonadaceae bacterium]|nr:adenylyl-sulfate kinase [Gemmatimonadaceae bacterium]